MSDTLIKDIRFFEANAPLDRPIEDATHSIPLVKFIIAEIELNSGITGQGYLLSFHYSPHAIRGALKDLADIVTCGFMVNETLKLNSVYARESEYFGNEGLLKWAIAIVNIAMWDAWAKVNKQPLWRLLDGQFQKSEVYGSGGWLSCSDDELLDEVNTYCKRGFHGVKIKVGHPDMQVDIHRLSKVREAVGKNKRIMMDANQGLDVSSAIQLARATEHLDIHWFEEPVDSKNYQGYSKIKKQLTIALAMGEREYDLTGLKNLTERKALDLWQPDIIRLGGVQGWLASARYANEHNILVLPHFYKEYDLHLLCLLKNRPVVEYFNWLDGLIDNPIHIQDGYASPSDKPGWGFSFIYDKMQPLKI
jgi:L-alanine-DL-glutamate epimerase-like enolase superfamily enzyme